MLRPFLRTLWRFWKVISKLEISLLLSNSGILLPYSGSSMYIDQVKVSRIALLLALANERSFCHILRSLSRFVSFVVAGANFLLFYCFRKWSLKGCIFQSKIEIMSKGEILLYSFSRFALPHILQGLYFILFPLYCIIIV